MSVIVITGAAGLVGSMLRPRLARPGRTPRLLDLHARCPANECNMVLLAVPMEARRRFPWKFRVLRKIRGPMIHRNFQLAWIFQDLLGLVRNTGFL